MTPATDRPVPDLNNTAEREYALRRAIDGLREDDPIRSASVDGSFRTFKVSVVL